MSGPDSQLNSCVSLGKLPNLPEPQFHSKIKLLMVQCTHWVLNNGSFPFIPSLHGWTCKGRNIHHLSLHPDSKLLGKYVGFTIQVSSLLCCARVLILHWKSEEDQWQKASTEPSNASWQKENYSLVEQGGVLDVTVLIQTRMSNWWGTEVLGLPPTSRVSKLNRTRDSR